MEWSCAAESVLGKYAKVVVGRPTEGKCPAARSDWGREKRKERRGERGSLAGPLSHLTMSVSASQQQETFLPLGTSLVNFAS